MRLSKNALRLIDQESFDKAMVLADQSLRTLIQGMKKTEDGADVIKNTLNTISPQKMVIDYLWDVLK